MRVEGIEKIVSNGRARVCATIRWEDCDLDDFALHFETTEEFAAAITCSADAFLLATFIPAMDHGERRVIVKGTLCPLLRNGVVNAMRQLRAWYGEVRHRAVDIEATAGFEAPRPDAARRTALFMSGGVDALAALRRNRLDLPLDHPAAVRDCYFVHGLDLASIESLERNDVHFEWARKQLAEFGRRNDFTLLPAYTNAPLLGGNYELFVAESHGAIIAAVAHVFGLRTTAAIISSSESVFDTEPWGSSPLLDPHYSSAALTIKHDSTALTRLEKVALIAQWPDALRYLRSCLDPTRGEVLNCGHCEKCLRTMAALLVCGKLHECPAFPRDDLPVELMETLNTMPARGRLPLMLLHHVSFWHELVAPLRYCGRADLAAVIEAKISESKRLRARREGRDWRGLIKRVDSRFAAGLGRRLYRFCRHLERAVRRT